jgi:Pectate lyase superfamily protein
MSLDAHANFAYTTVLVPPSPSTSGTTLAVNDPSPFPAPPFNATVWPSNTMALRSNAEIVRVTGITGSQFSITRVQEGTNARPISSGDQIAATITAKTLTDVEETGPAFSVKQYGAVGDGVNDDTAAIQQAITDAFAVPGGAVVFPSGQYAVTSTLTIPDAAGAIALLGVGKNRSFTGGVDGDPALPQGATIVYSGTTGDVLSASTTGTHRLYVAVENLAIEGNVASGTNGHGVHLQAADLSTILCTLRDFTVTGAKQHGIYFEGNVAESALYNVRASQNGDRGFIGAALGSLFPGEVRVFGMVTDLNAVGFDVSGGGVWAVYGLSSSANTTLGLSAVGVQFTCQHLVLEVNGVSGGKQAVLAGRNYSIIGVTITVIPAQSGIGLSFEGALFCSVRGMQTDSTSANVGFYDIAFDDASNRCTVEDCTSGDYVNRINLGAGAGHLVRLGAALSTPLGSPGFGPTAVSGQIYSQRYELGGLSGTITVDWNNGNAQSCTITADVSSIVLSNPNAGGVYMLEIAQDGTGGWSVPKTAWPSGTLFPGGGTYPTLETTAGSVTVFTAYYNGTAFEVNVFGTGFA